MEPRRINLMTVTQNEPPPPKKKKEENGKFSVRFELKLTESTDKACPEFSYTELVKNALPSDDEDLDPNDPFAKADKNEHDKMLAIAKKFESKYSTKDYGSFKRKRDRVEDLMDMGDGYDLDDPFIDNEEAYDELVPCEVTTRLGGFYINSGRLDFRLLSNIEDTSDMFQSPIKKKKKKKILNSDSENNSGASGGEGIKKRGRPKDDIGAIGNLKRPKNDKNCKQKTAPHSNIKCPEISKAPFINISPENSLSEFNVPPHDKKMLTNRPSELKQPLDILSPPANRPPNVENPQENKALLAKRSQDVKHKIHKEFTANRPPHIQGLSDGKKSPANRLLEVQKAQQKKSPANRPRIVKQQLNQNSPVERRSVTKILSDVKRPPTNRLLGSKMSLVNTPQVVKQPSNNQKSPAESRAVLEMPPDIHKLPDVIKTSTNRHPGNTKSPANRPRVVKQQPNNNNSPAEGKPVFKTPPDIPRPPEVKKHPLNKTPGSKKPAAQKSSNRKKSREVQKPFEVSKPPEIKPSASIKSPVVTQPIKVNSVPEPHYSSPCCSIVTIGDPKIRDKFEEMMKEKKKKRKKLSSSDDNPLKKKKLKGPKIKITPTVAEILELKKKAAAAKAAAANSQPAAARPDGASSPVQVIGSASNSPVRKPVIVDDSSGSNLDMASMSASVNNTKDSVISKQTTNEDEKKTSPENAQKLPDDLPSSLLGAIDSIKKEANQCSGGKQKFFSSIVNDLLLTIEQESRALGGWNRSNIYNHLACFLPCGKETLVKRAKKLAQQKGDDKLKEPIEKLRAAIIQAMPAQLEKHQQEVQAVMQQKQNRLMEQGPREEEKEKEREEESDEEGEKGEGGDKQKRLMAPRKKFEWNDHLRSLLNNVVRLKMEVYESSTNKTQTGEEYLRAFLDKEIRPLWPQGWMQTRMLFKESRKAHMMWTHTIQKPKKNLLAPPPKASGAASQPTTPTQQLNSPPFASLDPSGSAPTSTTSPIAKHNQDLSRTLLDFAGQSYEAAAKSKLKLDSPPKDNQKDSIPYSTYGRNESGSVSKVSPAQVKSLLSGSVLKSDTPSSSVHSAKHSDILTASSKHGTPIHSQGFNKANELAGISQNEMFAAATKLIQDTMKQVSPPSAKASVSKPISMPTGQVSLGKLIDSMVKASATNTPSSSPFSVTQTMTNSGSRPKQTSPHSLISPPKSTPSSQNYAGLLQNAAHKVTTPGATPSPHLSTSASKLISPGTSLLQDEDVLRQRLKFEQLKAEQDRSKREKLEQQKRELEQLKREQEKRLHRMQEETKKAEERKDAEHQVQQQMLLIAKQKQEKQQQEDRLAQYKQLQKQQQEAQMKLLQQQKEAQVKQLLKMQEDARQKHLQTQQDEARKKLKQLQEEAHQKQLEAHQKQLEEARQKQLQKQQEEKQQEEARQKQLLLKQREEARKKEMQLQTQQMQKLQMKKMQEALLQKKREDETRLKLQQQQHLQRAQAQINAAKPSSTFGGLSLLELHEQTKKASEAKSYSPQITKSPQQVSHSPQGQGESSTQRSPWRNDHVSSTTPSPGPKPIPFGATSPVGLFHNTTTSPSRGFGTSPTSPNVQIRNQVYGSNGGSPQSNAQRGVYPQSPGVYPQSPAHINPAVTANSFYNTFSDTNQQQQHRYQ